MKLSSVGELAIVDAVRAAFGKKAASVITGIGDDAAVIGVDKARLAVTTDMMVEGVHFDLRYTTPFQLGFKIISVNVSDIYAMGGKPRFALLGVALRGGMERAFIEDFFDGVKEALGAYGATLIGGDISSSVNDIALSGTLIGNVKNHLRRSGARPGNKIYVTGNLGDSACGLELLKKIKKRIDFKKPINKPLKWDIMEPLLRRHLMPIARRPVQGATSMMDISDGLYIDLYRLCKESGVGARLYKDKIPISAPMRIAAAYLCLDPFELAVSGGEDYELLFTAEPSKKVRASCIGEITGAGIFLVDEKGRKPIKPEGYEHFKEKD